VVDRVRPAVVNVTTNLFEQSSIGSSGVGRGVGTGFVVRPDGIVVTNYHVVEGATRITVITQAPDVHTYPARVIGGDRDSDFAVLKVQANHLQTVALGDSRELQLGQSVVAIGYALALDGGPSVTTGIVSAMGRVIQAADPNFAPKGIRTYANVIQTDAAINPGNSGGPLVDLSGRVVGIDTAGAQQAENIGFAIPINAAKPTIEHAEADPTDPVAYLGVVTQSMTPQVAFYLGLPQDTSGAYVRAVAPKGPAETAGIGRGDVIVRFDGNAVKDSEGLGALIHEHAPGDRVEVTVLDTDGKTQTYTASLGTNPIPASG
jgi:serine protease Do